MAIVEADITRIYRDERDRYVAFACSYVRDRDTAEELFMDTLVSMWQGRGQFTAETNCRALALVILKNKCLDYLKHRKLAVGVGKKLTENYTRDLNLRIATLEATEPERVFSDEIQRIVSRTLAELPEQSRRIFTMSRYGNKQNAEIARELNVSVKTVEYHITKSLRQLRVALRDYMA